MIVEVNKGLFAEYAQAGKGPVYMDCRGISPEDYAYMRHWFAHEGFDALTDHLDARGIDLREHPIEWATYGMRGSGGSIWQDLQGQTSLPGLYVAGDETSRSISPPRCSAGSPGTRRPGSSGTEQGGAPGSGFKAENPVLSRVHEDAATVPAVGRPTSPCS
jgi:hypothetical protein